MTPPPRLSVAIERWMDGRWNAASEALHLFDSMRHPLWDGLLRMPAPMRTDSEDLADWAEACDESVRLPLLLVHHDVARDGA